MTPEELQKRLKDFAYKVVKTCGQLRPGKESKIIEDQVIRSAFSAAANYRAACKAQSGKSFTATLSISYEEMDESLFWLEAIHNLGLLQTGSLSELLKEADELTRILAASRKTAQQKFYTS